MTEWADFDWAGVIFGVVVAAAGFGAAYWLWPSGVTEIPVSQLTLGQIFRVIGSLFLGLIGVAGVAGAIKDANEPFH